MDLTSYAELAVRLVNDGGHHELAAVFDAASREQEQEVVSRLNELLRQYPMTPEISGHDGQSWHLHLAERDDVLVKAVIGLAFLVTEFGPDRLGRCQAASCANAFLDTSSNRSRRYCSERCATRANVAAYRARRRTAASR
ncbi:CGNR zinc finger domain-containing protein [Nonomuraea sp. NPDC050310]|uniref:CGNR zinc finger domain-containing protein n=1 Tax=unclassified Nonomuraea TaxID=2593643 RepID=UPI0033D65C05